MSVCPVYVAEPREEHVCRGKLALLKGWDAGVIGPDREMGEALSRCLLCGRCQANCPNLAPTVQGLAAGRDLLAGAEGMSLIKKMLLQKALPRPAAMAALFKAGALAGPLAKAVPTESGLHLRLPGLKQAAALPASGGDSFLSRAPMRVAGPQGAPTLALFAGCVGNFLRPASLLHALNILSRRYTVLAPAGQSCCGLPAYSAGLGETTAALARKQAALFLAAKADRVVTLCGSCAHTMARVWPELLPEDPAVAAMAGKVVEISQVLAEEENLGSRLVCKAQGVALHHPCHLHIGLGVKEEPVAVLRAAGADLVDMAGADACCGGGGLFAVTQPELSGRIFETPARSFAASGAQILATSCSGCYLQWRAGLPKGVRVAHPVELLEPIA